MKYPSLNLSKSTTKSEQGATLIEYVVATAIFAIALIALQVIYTNLANSHVERVLRQQAERQSPTIPESITCLSVPNDGPCY